MSAYEEIRIALYALMSSLSVGSINFGVLPEVLFAGCLNDKVSKVEDCSTAFYLNIVPVAVSS